MSLKLTVYNETTVFAELRNEWNDLLEHSTANRIFSTWEWVSTWWETYQPGRLCLVACRDAGDRLVGLAPWFITQGNERVVSTIGCKDVSDYLDLIVDEMYVNAVLETLAAYLKHNLSLFDRIELCNIPSDSIGNSRFPAFLEAQGFQVVVEQEDVCPIIVLPDAWTDYLAQLDKKYRHELRRKLRRVQGSSLDVDWYIVSSEHDLHHEMEQFFELMAESDPLKAEFLADSLNRRFFERITPLLQEKHWLQLSFLRVNAEPAATYLNFDYNGHVLVYNSGLRLDHNALSPGIVLLANLIQDAIATGHEIFDFLQGDENYKYHLGGKDTTVVNLIAEWKET